ISGGHVMRIQPDGRDVSNAAVIEGSRAEGDAAAGSPPHPGEENGASVGKQVRPAISFRGGYGRQRDRWRASRSPYTPEAGLRGKDDHVVRAPRRSISRAVHVADRYSSPTRHRYFLQRFPLEKADPLSVGREERLCGAPCPGQCRGLLDAEIAQEERRRSRGV